MIDFNVIVSYYDLINISIELLKRCYNFKIFELRDSYIVIGKDKLKVHEAYIIHCRGELESYEMFKELYNFTEVEYEGRLSLI